MAAAAGEGRFAAAWRSVGRNLGWLIASRGVLAVLSLFYLGIATRSLGVVGFGRFALITGAAQALATLVAFQSWQIIVQYGVAAAGSGDEERLARLYRGTTVIDAAGAVVGSLLAWAILARWGHAFGISPTLRRATLVYSLVELLTVRSTPLGILRLRDRFSLAAAAESVTPVTRFLGSITVAFVHPTVQGFLAVWGLAELLTAAAYWAMAAGTGDLALLARGGGFRRLLREEPGLVRYALSTNASASLGLASKQVPLLVVGAALGPAAAGTFRLAAQLAQSLAKLSQLVSRAAFPEVVRALRDASASAVDAIVRRLVIASVAGGVAIMALVLLVGRPVLKLVGGHGFGHGYPVLVWMAAAGCVDLTTVGLDTVLTARGRAFTVFVLRAIGVGALFVAALWTLPAYGAIGMAMAVLAGSIATALLLAVASRR